MLDFNQQDAAQTAIIRSDLKQRGCSIGSYDILLAGTAVSRKLVFVTANVDEFKRVADLTIENWQE